MRVSRAARAGTVLVLDHLEDLFGEGGGPRLIGPLGNLLARAQAAAGARLRVLLSIDARSFHRLNQLHTATGLSPLPGSWRELDPLSGQQVEEIYEQTALQTGIFFEAGLASLVAGDLCREGSTSPLDLQIVARAMLDLRITSLRRYERSGGSEVLIPQFLDRQARDAGGPRARRVLLDVAQAGEPSPDEIAARTHLAREAIDAALGKFVSRGVLKKREAPRGERFSLAHPAMRAHVEGYMALARARGDLARRVLRRRILANQRLSVPEQIGVRRHLGGALGADEAHTYRRSVRRSLLQISLGVLGVGALAATIVFNLRTSYTIALEPAREPATAPSSFGPAAPSRLLLVPARQPG